MTEVTYKVDAGDALKALVIARAALQAADRGLGHGAALVHRAAVRLAPKADGTLHKNIQRSRVGVIIYEIVSRALHARYVEEGAKAHRLPPAGVNRIEAWIKRKGITARSVPQRDLAWVIAAKIGRVGTRAQPYMQPALDANTGRVQQLVRAAIDRALAPVAT